MAMADKIAILDNGRIQQFDTPEMLYHKPANLFVAHFMGNPPMNFIDASVEEEDGSWRYTFRYDFNPEMAARGYVCVDKGSVTVNGVSLTVCEPQADSFSVCIIPFTHEHTNFKEIKPGTKVNLEFDIIGKYIARISALS